MEKVHPFKIYTILSEQGDMYMRPFNKSFKLITVAFSVVMLLSANSVMAQTGSTVTGTSKEIKEQTDFSVRVVKEGDETKDEPAYWVTGHGYRMLPLRAVAEKVGYTVKWDQATRSAEVRKGASWTTVQKDTDYYLYNDMAPISLGIAPVIINGSLYVLQDFFSDVLQLSVELEQGTDSLFISQPQETQQQIVYENTKNKFTLQIPKCWEGKYEVIETDTHIIFIDKINKNIGGQLFQIDNWSKQKWNEEGEELVKNIHISKISEKGDQVFTLATPTDVQYTLDDEVKKKEYLSMSNDIEAIKTSFEFKK
jgi:hypothetical protein